MNFYILIAFLFKFTSGQVYQGSSFAGVDKIETVDVTPTQLIITTTKVGPVEDLHVFIDVVDIENGIHHPPMNLSGLLLLITRGAIFQNLIIDQNEQKHNNEVHTNFEEKLVRTLPSPEGPLNEEDKILQKPPIEVTVDRATGNGKSMENLLITLKWVLPTDYRTNLQAVTNISLFCKDHVRYKILKLADEESAKALEVKLENTLEISEKKNNTRNIIANILPKSCFRICWDSELMAFFEHHNFGKEVGKDCREISPVTAETSLRDYLSYDVNQGDLVIHTNVTGNYGNEDAIVTIEAIQLPEGVKIHDNLTNIVENFKTTESETEFILHGLNPNKYYAVQYSYTKRSPFFYSESERFIIEPRTSSTGNPLKVRFTTKDLNSTSNSTNPEIKPEISMLMDASFNDFRIGVDVDPFCDAKGPNASQHFWLSKDQPRHILDHLDLVSAICGTKPEHSYCGIKRDAYSHIVPGVSNITVCSSPNLCYAGNIEVNGKIYAMKKRC
ncbi:hypothetical protein FO519_003512 [Halicephalobus sp. NKZ332]|nr:hypothetical protein FO519_003512 [Halicephalobus sp. NKZ332]